VNGGVCRSQLKCDDAIICRLLDMLTAVGEYADVCPPIEQPQRFGNHAYRLWYDMLREVAFLSFKYDTV
jgi:hypothetical protein